MHSVRVIQPDTLPQLVDQAVSNGDSVYVLFFGREEGPANESWCPDCVIAEPLVRQALVKLGRVTLLEFPLDRRTNRQEPYWRSDVVTITAIPTLVRCDTLGLTSQALVEADCYDPVKLSRFLGVDSA
ncbi:hypothetical protein IWQ61_005826 [Dispira simplex]|nr:hypothetical protein IWQ61_005826 [Dispira simplex]